MLKWASRLTSLTLLLFAPLCLHAQDNSSMTGTVTDPSGAVIPGAVVVLANKQTGGKYTQVTDSRGTYRFANVPPAPSYTASFSHAGFNVYTVSNVALQVGITRTQDAKLAAGATEEVTVSAAGAEDTINTTDASIGNNLDVKVLNELPVQDRSGGITTLFYLQPGVDRNSGSVTGARTDQSSVTVDGMDVNDIGAGGTFGIDGPAPIDSIEEFRGVVAGMPLNIGTGSGGQFQLVTKQGTNSFHGDLNEYNRNTDTAANTWYGNNLGLARTPLIRNQFGGAIGGPIKKDKLFFFFDFNDSRIIQSATEDPTVPLDSFRNGTLNYVTNAAGCADGSRLNTAPNCIAQLSSGQVTALDPAHIGFSQNLLTVINARYPHANDFTHGDGVNTAGYAFTEPDDNNRTDYVLRVDYNLTPKQRVFGRVSIGRQNAVYSPGLFLGDAPSTQFTDRSYSYVASHEWQIGTNKVNQFYYGDVVTKYGFPTLDTTGANTVGISGLTGPYNGPGSQARRIPIPEVRDDFNWNIGRHNLSFGGTFKFIKTDSYLQSNFNGVTIGQSGTQLYGGLEPSVRPSNIGTGQTAIDNYDSLFPAALGIIGSIGAGYVYDAKGVPFTQGSGSYRNYRFFETETYVGDNWKMTPHLTMTYGVRYQFYSVPYETHGIESVQYLSTGSNPAGTFDNYFNARTAQSAAGLSGNNAVPIISYKLGGKANNGPNLYAPSYKDFAPRVAFAYNPAWSPKTVFNVGAGLVYDRTVINAINFIQDQSSYIFQGSATANFGSPNGPAASLAVDPRIGPNLSFDPTLVPAAPKINVPYTPYVDLTSGQPYGLPVSTFNTAVDPTLKDPYSIALNAGMQTELPDHFLLKLSYAGRLGRRLLAQVDGSQLIDNPDPTGKQLMSQAFAAIELQERAGVDPKSATGLTAQPWFENVLSPGVGKKYHYANNTSFVGGLEGILVPRGDMADMIQNLAYYTYYYGVPGLPTNVGMASQLAENTFITNKGFSTYNGLLVTLEKNLSNGLQFSANYTWSHSIDNTSLVANSIAFGGYGFICDATRPRECRANSDFDVTQNFNANFVYALPFGRNRQFFANDPRWLDEAIGGWSVSGITDYRTGQALNVFSSAFVAGYANTAPAIFTGANKRDLKAVVNKQSGSYFQFQNPTAAFNDFEGPVGLQIGQRNDFRGPGVFDFDAGLAKTFAIIPNDRLNLKFRADAFNVFNHPTYGAVSPSIGSSNNFGQISGAANGYQNRVLQGALRLEF